MGAESHRQQAGERRVGLAVFTLSDTRTPETDTSGRLIRELAGFHAGMRPTKR